MLLEAHAEVGGRPFDRVEALRLTYADASAQDLLRGLLAEYPGEVALVSSFGADSAVLLHMVARIDSDLPVLFAETQMLFEETLAYQRELSTQLGLTNVRSIRPDAGDLARLDPQDVLHGVDPDACCVIRKVAPLDRALRRYPVAISGRKRFQSATRAELEVFESELGQVRVSPLASWGARDIAAYLDAHELPRHPLVARGFASIGCEPCTTAVAPGEASRAGRWRGHAKTECGIHFGPDGALRRAS